MLEFGDLLDMEEERERGIKLNMKVSDWDGWAVRGWYLTRGRDGRVRFEV